MRSSATRRELAQSGAALGAALLCTSALAPLRGLPDAFAQSGTDADLLRSAIGLEETLVAAYATALTRPGLDSATRRLVGTLRRHEQEHANALIVILKAAVGETPRPPRGGPMFERFVRPLQQMRGARQVLAFAIELERAAVGTYHRALPKLVDPHTIQSAASIMGAEGQHLVLLRAALGLQILPSTLEAGTS